MSAFGITVLVFAGLTAVHLLYMAAYTRFARAIDHRKKAQAANAEPPDGSEAPRQQVSLVRRVYRYFEGFSYGLMRYSLLRTGKIPSFAVRRFLYRRVFCMDITRHTKINGDCEFRSPWNIHADRCIIAVGCILDGRSGITIGQDVVFGGSVHVWTQEHSVDDPYFRVLPANARPVTIGDRAWICSDSTILPGCTIGEGAVIAARACVVKDCEPFGIYGGVPAKKLGERNHELLYHLQRRPSWFFY